MDIVYTIYMNQTNCIYPECKILSSTRDLCHKHYVSAARLVRLKRTTWDALEKAGKCGAAIPASQRAGRAPSWFMESEQPGPAK